MRQCLSPQRGIIWSGVPLNRYILNILDLRLMVSEKKIFKSFSHFKSMGAKKPRGVASLDPRDMVGRIYVGDHLTLLHTKYLCSGPYGFREEDFLSISHYKSVDANEPRGVANLDPRGMVGRIYVGDHLSLLHTKYLSSEPYGFNEEDF